MIKESDLKNWNKCKDSLPEEGVLCVVFFPICVIDLNKALRFGGLISYLSDAKKISDDRWFWSNLSKLNSENNYIAEEKEPRLIVQGPISLAYYRKDEGWIYADNPRKLNWNPILLKTAYWKPFMG